MQMLSQRALVERIGIDGSVIKLKPSGKDKVEIETSMKRPQRRDETGDRGADGSCTRRGFRPSGICAVGHRIVHGGEKFSESVLITDEVMEAIKENIELAPLHNPANLMGIDACRALMPDVPMVGVFDTAFHANMPKKRSFTEFLIRFIRTIKSEDTVSTGHPNKYVSHRSGDAWEGYTDLKIITCHLGNGSSVAAVDGGVSGGYVHGLHALEGLVMGTRSATLTRRLFRTLWIK